jgi:hypothetical protein
MATLRAHLHLLAALLTLWVGAPALAAIPIGHFDVATETYVAGWAFDPDHPSSQIALHVYVDGQFAAAGDTSGLRPDVNAAFGITGNHGFGIPVDVGAFGAGAHSVVVYAIDPDGEGNPGIDGSPKIVTTVCHPQCSGRECGDDGCGGTCGSCAGGQACSLGVCAGPPDGSLDAARADAIAGWAHDPDHDGPLNVHIYIDGQLMKVIRADGYRSDVGNHAFHWVPPPFGHGSHEVIAFAIGVDASGAPDGQNPALAHSPRSFTATCAGLQADAYGWCTGMPPYWTTRQSDTTFVGNDSVRVGVDNSYGGTVFQLYGPGWDNNLILEHGGGAMQLSIWGYDPVGPAGWFSNGTCDRTPYPTQAACNAAGHSSCSIWAHGQGAHVSDCVSEQPCTGWTPGSPWNPIQAQGPGCGWDSPLNDVNAAGWQGETYYTKLNAPFHFTSTQAAVPMPMEQWVTPRWGYVEIRYRLTYNGPTTWSFHPQEIPAIFTAPGMNANFYYYGGDRPFTGDAPRQQSGGSSRFVRFPNRAVYGHGEDYDGYAREGWWGACDASGSRCLTVASFSPLINEVALQSNQGAGSGYLTALGWFNVQPGMVLDWTIYVFPKRYDQVSGDRTVREHIYSLAPADFVAQTCVPQCAGATCGSDGCGGTCGSCAGTLECLNRQCVCDAPCGDCLGDTGDDDLDGVCDPVDACLGDDAAGDVDGDGICEDRDPCAGVGPDSDGDGVCDDLDVCQGQDASGDHDGDGVCTDLDACHGSDPTGDPDDDGVCTDLDLCFGDNVTGDSDRDGLCDDRDLALELSAVRRGQPLSVRLTGAPPGATATFFVSTRAGRTCHPTLPHLGGGQLCLGLAAPITLGSARASAAGVATLTVVTPTNLPVGTQIWAQGAVVVGGTGNSSEVEGAVVQ